MCQRDTKAGLCDGCGVDYDDSIHLYVNHNYRINLSLCCQLYHNLGLALCAGSYLGITTLYGPTNEILLISELNQHVGRNILPYIDTITGITGSQLRAKIGIGIAK